jgi:hypothetical protein
MEVCLRICLWAVLIAIAEHSPAQLWCHELHISEDFVKSPSPDCFALHSLQNRILMKCSADPNDLSAIELSLRMSVANPSPTQDAKSYLTPPFEEVHFPGQTIESATFNLADSILYFSSEQRNGKMRLYASYFRKGRWTPPTPLIFSSENSDDLHPYFDNQRRILYFASRRTGSLGGLDIWYARNTMEGWTSPVNPGNGVNSPMNEMHPTICHEDLLYSSDQDVQGAGFDLRLATAKSNFHSSLSLPEPLNSDRNDLRMIQLSENHFLILRSEHKKSTSYEWVCVTQSEEEQKLWYRLMRDSVPAAAERLILQVEGGDPVICESDNAGYLAIHEQADDLPQRMTARRLQLKLDKNSKQCEFQVLDQRGRLLHSVRLTPGETVSLEPLDLLLTESKQWNPGDESRLDARKERMILPRGFSLLYNHRGEPVAIKTGEIQTTPHRHPWILQDELSLPCHNELPAISMHLPLLEPEKNLSAEYTQPSWASDDCWRIDRIYFDKASDSLSDMAISQCKILLELMWLNPELMIELTGSTDFDGGSDFNEKLGMQRCQSVRDALVKLGIPTSRIQTKSRGELCGCSFDSAAIRDKISPVLRRVDIRYKISQSE